ncbi:hypothetical protein DP131_07095 [Clostridium tetani]|uniref:ABC transporter permease n=2 Tax=Clostridium tetani TaxID=1513 RepID=A0ABY0ESA1_CLOTA|nr:hypothetical protein DP131_07095 [Clostridium tetani]RXI70445.1 hypothetical protein DQN76_06835 [Clostridium tetani]
MNTMKKFLHNPLFYKDFKNARWISLAILLYLIRYKFLILTQHFNSLKISLIEAIKSDSKSVLGLKENLAHWFKSDLLKSDQDTIIITILILFLLTLLFRYERNSATFSFTASMPFKRKEIIKVKWLTGVFSIVLPLFITFILLTTFYFKNINWIEDSYIIILQWFLINALTFTAIFSFIFFIQTLMGKSAPASIIGALILLLPGAIIVLSTDFILACFKDISYPSYVRNLLQNTILYIINTPDLNVFNSNYNKSNIFYYRNLNVKIIALILVCIITYILSIYCFKRNDFEKTGHLVLFKPFEYILKFIIAIFLGLLMALIFGQSYAEDTLVVMYVSLTLGFLASYFITDKCIKYYSK